MRILIAEDDPRISQRLRDALTAAGFVVEHEADGDDAWHRGDTEDFDAIVLDLGLPSQDGLSILRQWRKAGRSAPVRILSARSQWDERVAGIELGADDYVTKPFRMEEVVARVRALIRRSAGQVSPQIPIGGGLMLDTRMMQVTRSGVPLPLTRRNTGCWPIWRITRDASCRRSRSSSTCIPRISSADRIRSRCWSAVSGAASLRHHPHQARIWLCPGR